MRSPTWKGIVNSYLLPAGDHITDLELSRARVFADRGGFVCFSDGQRAERFFNAPDDLPCCGIVNFAAATLDVQRVADFDAGARADVDDDGVSRGVRDQ